MADAPRPVYNSQGRPMGDWLIVVRYDSVRDVTTISWTRDATPWSRRQQGAEAYPVDRLEDLQEDLRRQVRMLAEPRLF